ncbi:MAG: PAS domain S-box protein [Polyangiaceae bacterium]|nr:PAS domain S-box protein [Polyangiaceae bacterium]
MTPAHFLLLETAPDAMLVLGADARIVFVNAQTEAMFGFGRDELIGQPLDAILPPHLRGAHEGHVARFFAHPTVRRMGSGLELHGQRRDGTDLPIEVSLSPVVSPSGEAWVSAAIRDITQRKRAEAALRLNAELLASAVEGMQDGVAMFGPDGRLVLCNGVYRVALAGTLHGPAAGVAYEEVCACWLDRHAPGDDADTFRAAWVASGRAPTSTELRTRDGRTLRLARRATPEGGLVETVWDLTDDMLKAEELRAARVAAEAGSAAKSEFLSSMSHELRTPMNAILGFAQLLQRDKKEPLSARQQERLAQIMKGGEHLLRLIDDVLDLARIEAGGVSVSTEPVDVDDVFDAVRELLEPMAARVGVTIARDRAGELPMVLADRTRVVQIVMNFGSNAIKYNRPGGHVTLAAVAGPGADGLDAGFVRISVHDDGLGIDEAQHASLFQPFQRAGQETGAIEGTGIGLVITKRLAALMGGRHGFRSERGRGSEFWVDLPAHHGPRRAAPAGGEPRERREQSLGADQRLVLYIEDNQANVAFMTDLVCTFDGVELVTAPTAEQGIELARRLRPKAILMDINLPGISGFDALDELRRWPETTHIPVIALTAAASERDQRRGRQAGFFRYLTKPVKVDELEAALSALL